jgi:hypothetical protein
VHDAQHRHGVADVVVAIDNYVRRDNADANGLTERGTRRAATRMIGETIIKPFEKLVVLGGRAPTGFRREVGE